MSVFRALTNLVYPDSENNDDRWADDYRVSDLPTAGPLEYVRSSQLFQPLPGTPAYVNSDVVYPSPPPPSPPPFIRSITRRIVGKFATYRDYYTMMLVVYLLVLHLLVFSSQRLIIAQRGAIESLESDDRLVNSQREYIDSLLNRIDLEERTRRRVDGFGIQNMMINTSIRRLVDLIGLYIANAESVMNLDVGRLVEDIVSLPGLNLTTEDAEIMLNTYRASRIALVHAAEGTPLPDREWVRGVRIQDGNIHPLESTLLTTVQTLALELNRAEEAVDDINDFALLHGVDLPLLYERRQTSDSNARNYRRPTAETHAQMANEEAQRRMREMNNLFPNREQQGGMREMGNLLQRIATASGQSEESIVRSVQQEAETVSEAGPSSSSTPMRESFAQYQARILESEQSGEGSATTRPRRQRRGRDSRN